MEGYFEQVVDALTGAGYRWYETANFCLRARARRAAATSALATTSRTGSGATTSGSGSARCRRSTGVRRRNLAVARPLRRRAAARARRRRASSSRSTRTTRTRERLLLGLRLDEPLALDEVERRARPRRGGAARRPAGSSRSAPTAPGRATLTLTRRGRFLGGGVTRRAARLSRRAPAPAAGARWKRRGYHRVPDAAFPPETRDSAARRRGVRRDRPARGLARARGALRAERLAVDGAQRARRARDARTAHAPAHVGRAHADRERLPALRRGARRDDGGASGRHSASTCARCGTRSRTRCGRPRSCSRVRRGCSRSSRRRRSRRPRSATSRCSRSSRRA